MNRWILFVLVFGLSGCVMRYKSLIHAPSSEGMTELRMDSFVKENKRDAASRIAIESTNREAFVVVSAHAVQGKTTWFGFGAPFIPTFQKWKTNPYPDGNTVITLSISADDSVRVNPDRVKIKVGDRLVDGKVKRQWTSDGSLPNGFVPSYWLDKDGYTDRYGYRDIELSFNLDPSKTDQFELLLDSLFVHDPSATFPIVKFNQAIQRSWHVGP